MTEYASRQAVVSDSLNWFKLRGVATEASLLGSKHQFEFEGHHVEIKLPDLSKLRDPGDDHAALIPSGRYTNEMQPVSYKIQLVEIKVKILQELLVDPETFNRTPVAYDLYSESEQLAFERMCAEYRMLSKRAFEYWVSILRWKLNDFRIGQDEIDGIESSWSCTLQDHIEGRVIWQEALQYSFPGFRVVEKRGWNQIQTVLIDNESPPVYDSALVLANTFCKHGNLGFALVQVCVACESVLAESYERYLLSRGVSKKKYKDAEKDITYSYLLNLHLAVFKDLNELEGSEKILDRLNWARKCRNDVVHEGKVKQDVKSSEVIESIESAKKTNTICSISRIIDQSYQLVALEILRCFQLCHPGHSDS